MDNHVSSGNCSDAFEVPLEPFPNSFLDLNVRAQEEASSHINIAGSQSAGERHQIGEEGSELGKTREEDQLNKEVDLTTELGRELGVDLSQHKNLVEDIIRNEGIQPGKI
ncbi:hypothetical protein HanXRQr2_Chr10g0419521 [Helianthus annuus]|uniref:Uncharacterized protein n=1 Tax=Helianthus annuus TaxID=4232 RepID=A0A9K3HTY3_HELAN|nr:hypothetical protein HanXRQr2_Chr10g0419521 [Helianthus annuus]KAJ0882093.1 hypothetical protein HanPSC8_Chr10g0405671 [Helianthus annuus]